MQEQLGTLTPEEQIEFSARYEAEDVRKSPQHFSPAERAAILQRDERERREAKVSKRIRNMARNQAKRLQIRDDERLLLRKQELLDKLEIAEDRLKMAEDMARKVTLVDHFLEHVLHGDEGHRNWLINEFNDYFSPLKHLAHTFLENR